MTMRSANNFSKSETSKEVALRLLDACSAKAVNEVLGEFPEFGDETNWKPYGNAEKNWDRVGNQSSDPVGALTELLINSIDAILMRRAKEENIDFKGDDAPQSMHEAVKRFFPEVNEGKLDLIAPEQRTTLAEKSVVVGVKRKKKGDVCPTYTIIDFGEGQNHGDFAKTFLSLGEKNKEGIPFVQGRFNMGSTGSIRFCTRSDLISGHYKFILSKRNLDDSDGLWGWTVIRVRKHRKGESLPVAEYFCPNGKIACFPADEIQAIGVKKVGTMRGGSVVKLYEYDIGPGANRIDFGLRDSLITNLIDCALPIRLYDFNAEKNERRPEGIADRTFSGMNTEIKFGEKDGHEAKGIQRGMERSENPDLGRIKIRFFASYDKVHDAVKRGPYRVFFTINGQTQAKLRASTFKKMNLDTLRDHLIVQVDCNAMDNTARAGVFMLDRERMCKSRFAISLQEIVFAALKENKELRQFAEEIRERRVSQQILSEEDKIFLAEFVKSDPNLLKLFDIGVVVPDITAVPKGGEKYKGEQFPTFLTPINLDEGNVKTVPINTHRRIECNTDAANDYLVRDGDQGEFVCPESKTLPHSQSLRNGKLRITVHPPRDAKVGDKVTVRFGFNDNNPARSTPLVFDVTVQVGAKEEIRSNPGGGKTNTTTQNKPKYEFPNIEWVRAGDSNWVDREFDAETGGDIESGPPLTIYVNQDHRYLVSVRKAENDESKQKITDHRFKIGVGLLTLGLYKRLVDDYDDENDDTGANLEEREKSFRIASSAIAPIVVALIEKLGGSK